MDGAAAVVAIHVAMRSCMALLLHRFLMVLLSNVVVMLITQAQLHGVAEIEMQACGFGLLSCCDTACYACHHYHLY